MAEEDDSYQESSVFLSLMAASMATAVVIMGATLVITFFAGLRELMTDEE